MVRSTIEKLNEDDYDVDAVLAGLADVSILTANDHF